MRNQQTLSKSAFFNGIGLHSGNPVSMAVHPAPVHTGIVFVRQVGEHILSLPASIDFLGNTDHCTTLESEDFRVQTVEHILAALAGLEVDNAYVELEGQEIPAADGSAGMFVETIQQTGIVQQEAIRTHLKIIESITVGDHQRSITVSPSPLPKISYFIDFPNHPLIQHQEFVHNCTPLDFHKQVAPARTFAFRKEVEYLWSHGLGLGGSLQNTVVFSDTDLVNEDGLRFPDECVRHKVLDLIGDLTLLGIPVIGHFEAKCSGHWLHAELVKSIKNQPEKWILFNPGPQTKSDITTVAKQQAPASFLPDLQPAFQTL